MANGPPGSRRQRHLRHRQRSNLPTAFPVRPSLGTSCRTNRLLGLRLFLSPCRREEHAGTGVHLPISGFLRPGQTFRLRDPSCDCYSFVSRYCLFCGQDG